MTRWVSSYWQEGDITFLWEVQDDGWITRSVELSGAALTPTAATDLDEVMRARDERGLSAVQAIEARYGVAPEKPIEDWDFPHEAIAASEFDRQWRETRALLEAG